MKNEYVHMLISYDWIDNRKQNIKIHGIFTNEEIAKHRRKIKSQCFAMPINVFTEKGMVI